MDEKYFKKTALRLNQKDDHSHQATQYFDENDSFLQEQTTNEARLVEYKKKLRQATFAFSRALEELNKINGQLGRGPVSIKAELRHHCISQKDLNDHYAEEEAHYNVKLVRHLQHRQNADSNDREM